MNKIHQHKPGEMPWRTRREEPLRWRKIKRQETNRPENFLRRREPYCVGACGRFLDRNSGKDQIWTLEDKKGLLSALLFYSKRTLFPVFNGKTDIPLTRFVRRYFRTAPVHAVQGVREEALVLEDALAELGIRTGETIDYDLMALDSAPEETFRAGPPGLIVRRPDMLDMDALFALQKEYEKEEVLPQGAVFNPVSCKLGLQRIMREEHILAAELDGRVVGKINTSARSFTRCQIGGVYVHPDYRGRGIARRMTGVFVQELIAQGWGITLFVKKQNPAALSVYRGIGFEFFADYRISYY
jgi:ribosomal protein S18 acetylase RimI-like enzyme